MTREPERFSIYRCRSYPDEGNLPLLLCLQDGEPIPEWNRCLRISIRSRDTQGRSSLGLSCSNWDSKFCTIQRPPQQRDWVLNVSTDLCKSKESQINGTIHHHNNTLRIFCFSNCSWGTKSQEDSLILFFSVLYRIFLFVEWKWTFEGKRFSPRKIQVQIRLLQHRNRLANSVQKVFINSHSFEVLFLTGNYFALSI